MTPTIIRIRNHPLFRAAIAAPIAIMVIFSLFNLTAAPDQQRVPGAIAIGVVNLDEGGPMPEPMSERILSGVSASLPTGIVRFDSEAVAEDALENGDVSAVLIVPPDFSRAVASGETAALRLRTSQHLTLAETQFTASLGRQFEAAFSAAIAGMRLAEINAQTPSPDVGAGGGPAAIVTTDLLYTANNATSLSAPFVMTFATWMSAFVGALMTFLATRAEKGRESTLTATAVRTLLPIMVATVASLALAVVVAWTTENWSSLLALWLLIWIAQTAIWLILEGLFAIVGFFALLIAIPAVFYQGALSGTQLPTAAAPDWLASIADFLPFSAIGGGYRAIVIGGPDGSQPFLLLFAIAAIGIALIWLGTWLHHHAMTQSGHPARD